MSRQKQGIRLPYAIEKELGLELRSARGGKRHDGSVGGRREQRKAERVEKKTLRGGRGGGGFSRFIGGRNSLEPATSIGEDKDGEEEESEPELQRKSAKTKRPRAQPEPKSILKKPGVRRSSPDISGSEYSSRSSSPALVLDASSRAFKDRSAEEDAEILALEKRLGLKTKKLPKSFGEDGLGELLDGLEEEDETRKRKREGRDWLERKRRKAEDIGSSDGEDEEADVEMDSSGDSEAKNDEDEDGDGDFFDGFDSDETPPLRERHVTKTRENPYVAPITSDAPVGKYVPPSLRKLQNNDDQSLERLKRQIQGYLNKLSEANLISILGEIEKIYQSNPRQDVTSVLTDLLLSLFANRSALQNTFVILHAAFITAVYKVIGTDFGADILAKLTERFQQYHGDTAAGKEGSNLISLLSNLFIFGLVGSPIVFDHVRILLENLSETNTELVLRAVRDCGPQLRQDDPTALKSIVQMMQNSAKQITDAGGHLSVRTQFMMETIIDLKNNKMKEATSNAGATREHFTRMRKVLGSLNSRNLRASEPLRISLDDIKQSDQKGKWWLVGASWKGNEASSNSVSSLTNPKEPNSALNDIFHDPSDSEPDLPALARHYRMNTQIRRSIFIAIMSASNYQDAHVRIAKLRLKRTQESEIAHVLLRCAGSETTYNPYYTVLAKRLCTSVENTKRMRKTFEFALWGLFRRTGETNHDNNDDEDHGDDENEEDTVEVQEIANLARLYASLVTVGIMSLSALKVLDLAYLKEKALIFVEYLLVTILVESSSKDEDENERNAVIGKVFERAADEAPQIVSRLMLFIKTHVRESDLVVGHKDRKAVKVGYQVALKTLARRMRAEGGS